MNFSPEKSNTMSSYETMTDEEKFDFDNEWNEVAAANKEKKSVSSEETIRANEAKIQENAEQLQEAKAVDMQKTQVGLNKAREQLGIDVVDDNNVELSQNGDETVDLDNEYEQEIQRKREVHEEKMKKTQEKHEQEMKKITEDGMIRAEEILNNLNMEWNSDGVDDTKYTAELFQQDMQRYNQISDALGDMPNMAKMIKSKQEEIAKKRGKAYEHEQDKLKEIDDVATAELHSEQDKKIVDLKKELEQKLQTNKEEHEQKMQEIKEIQAISEKDIKVQSEATLDRMQTVLDETLSQSNESSIESDNKEYLLESVQRLLNKLNVSKVADVDYTSELFSQDMRQMNMLRDIYQDEQAAVDFISEYEKKVALAKRGVAYKNETE